MLPARQVALLVVSSLLLLSCGGGSDETGGEPDPSLPSPSTTSTAPSGPPSVPTTTASDPEPAPPSSSRDGSERPLAPDFTLELGEGGTFTLSEETRPVFLVFWAEW